MALIVEDGSIVANANSYVSLVDVENYAALRGLSTWTGTDAVKEAAIINAMDYIESQNYKGFPAQSSQALRWPRAGVIVEGNELAYNSIPYRVRGALCSLAVEQISGDIMPSLDRGGAVKREKVDVLEVEYFSGAPTSTVYQRAESMLRQYLNSSTTLALS